MDTVDDMLDRFVAEHGQSKAYFVGGRFVIDGETVSIHNGDTLETVAAKVERAKADRAMIETIESGGMLIPFPLTPTTDSE